jgi:TPR repeat protein
VQNDRGKVLNWYLCAAEQGDGEAQLRAGIILLGRAVEQSLAEKRDRDDSPLQPEGLYWLRRAAEQGNPEAQYDLGRRLLHDDPEAALHWFERAAGRDHDKAQYELGEIYREGNGAPAGVNHAEAAKWYLLAAERGNGSAQARIGDMLYSGTGVPQDLVKAYEWLNLAAAQSSRHPDLEDYNKRLIALRDSAAARLTPEQITAAQRLTSQWHPQPSTANSVVEWREHPAIHRAEKEPTPPSAYSRCELE